jgi:uncharacterized protein (DUF1697 family)
VTRYVALLRGVNVGGRTLKMAHLREILDGSRATDVATYIQSGNIVLSHPSRSARKLAQELEELIHDGTGMDVPVIARTAAEWDELVEANPYPDAAGTQLHVVFLDGAPASDALDHLDLPTFAPEECVFVGRQLYLHLPGGMGRSPLAAELSKRRGTMTTGTARNWNTVLKLQELLADA